MRSSLRGRVTVGVLGLLAVLLVLLFVAVDLLLGARLRSDLRTRLTDRAALAQQLDGSVSAQSLVDQLRGDGVTVQLCSPSDGCVVADTTPKPPDAPSSPPGRPGAGPRPTPAPAARTASVQQSGSTLFVRETLDDGDQLTLSLDGSAVHAALSRLVLLEVVGGLAALLVAGLLLGRVVGAALRPLDRMTALATDIARGDRGRRLGDGPGELGRTASAFDAMLDELESALASAHAAEARLRAFLSDASHELRTPLTGLQATAEQLLRRDPARAERERLLATVVRESARASRLVEDLLTASRGAAGLSLQRAPVDLGRLVAAEVERFRPLAPDVAWSVSGAGAVVSGDAGRLGQVLANLLENARRAVGPTGSVDVVLDGSSLEVRDSGPGVPAESLEAVFERFVRLDPSRTRASGGSGLGLPIARAIAVAHGGTLVALPGPGGRFRLSLPEKASAAGLPARPATPVR